MPSDTTPVDAGIDVVRKSVTSRADTSTRSLSIHIAWFPPSGYRLGAEMVLYMAYVLRNSAGMDQPDQVAGARLREKNSVVLQCQH